MAGMIVQHNLNAINANNKLAVNVLGTKKATEKLSSGFRINRAADDAAGLAISEKMRAQIKGLSAAIRNANDGIGLIQTAEGALDETHGMLKRLKELAVLAGNDTYSNEERDYMQMKIEEIKNEIDRIAKATDFNGIKLLDGSLSGGRSGDAAGGLFNEYGARYGISQFSAAFGQNISVAANAAGVVIEFTTGASGKGGENAFWDETGKRLTINLANGESYTDSRINALIKTADIAKQNPAAPANVEWSAASGVICATEFTMDPTVGGIRQQIEVDLLPLQLTNGIEGYADKMRFISNQYGSHAYTDGMFATIRIATDVGAGQEKVSVVQPAESNVSGVHITLHLSTGIEYTNRDIENLLRQAGFDYSVEMWTSGAPNGFSTAFFAQTDVALQSFPGSLESIYVPGTYPTTVYQTYKSDKTLASMKSDLEKWGFSTS
ncbi:MAG: flagellar hook protein [Oscillospiraceae bacterium]|jgi:flagellin|nr:flagellar hook protein [Oscillospiraceae bacterium]